MSKTISINPDLFRFTNNRTTRKKKDKTGPELKIRNQKEKVQSLRRNSILKHIRQQQEKNYKNLLNQDVGGQAKVSTLPIENDFNSDFDESIKYMMAIEEKNKNIQQKINI